MNKIKIKNAVIKSVDMFIRKKVDASGDFYKLFLVFNFKHGINWISSITMQCDNEELIIFVIEYLSLKDDFHKNLKDIDNIPVRIVIDKTNHLSERVLAIGHFMENNFILVDTGKLATLSRNEDAISGLQDIMDDEQSLE